MKGTKDITQSDRVSKEVSDDYTRFSVQQAQISDSGTYFVVARNNFGTDRIFVTVTVHIYICVGICRSADPIRSLRIIFCCLWLSLYRFRKLTAAILFLFSAFLLLFQIKIPKKKESE